MIRSPCALALLKRTEANRIMFDELDGQTGERTANEIVKFSPQLKKIIADTPHSNDTINLEVWRSL